MYVHGNPCLELTTNLLYTEGHGHYTSHIIQEDPIPVIYTTYVHIRYIYTCTGTYNCVCISVVMCVYVCRVSSRGVGGGRPPTQDLCGDIPPRLIFTDTQISCTGFVKTLVKILKIPPECRKLIAKIPNFLRVQCLERTLDGLTCVHI